jgi:NAD(P)-dependent dehydrogenase (short-subunit alcohol dehydrogenase family)
MLRTTEESEVPGSVRIINISSAGHFSAIAPGINFDDLNHGNTWQRYAQSKLANILHAKALAKHYPTIKSVAIHPGTAGTAIFDKMNNRILNILIALFGWVVFVSIEQAAKNQLWASTAAEKVESGAYYDPVGIKSEGSFYAQSEELENALWEWTESELTRQGY